MARLVEWHNDHARDAECVRFRAAVRRRRVREWLRPIPCRCQRPLLVPPAKEEILVAPEQLTWKFQSSGNIRCAEIRASKKSSPLSRPERDTNYTNCHETRIPPIITNFRRISPALVAGNSGAALTFQRFKALTWRSHSCGLVKF